MDPLELRKVIVVGSRYDCPDGAPLLGHDGLPASPLEYPIRLQVAFWVPVLPQHRQRRDGSSLVIDCRPFERDALRAGVIEEVVVELTFERQPSIDEMRRRLVPVWEGLAHESLGRLDRYPTDPNPNPSFQMKRV